MRRLLPAAALAAFLVAGPACAQSLAELSKGWVFGEHGGEALYAHVCAGCHQPDGGGAVGAGAYPALARNPNLASATYVENLVVSGRAAMPPIGAMMSDEQVADVVNYVRARFGDFHDDQVSAVEVGTLRSGKGKNP